jgi:DNA-directed RNA polymerase specialized sigma24 family protein
MSGGGFHRPTSPCVTAAELTRERLSQISTMWTALMRAHGGAEEEGRRLLAGLIERYHGAAYRYLAAATGNADVAAELFQEFAVRFLRGDFRWATPGRGRFRDYLRTALIHLARHGARDGRRRSADVDLDLLPASDASEDEDEAFLGHWRAALLDRAWAGLEAAERAGGPPHHTALRARVDEPDAASADLAARLTRRLKPAEPFTDAGVRKLLQRGREVLTDRLVAEVAASVPTRDRERLAQELIDLGFYGYCKKALERWSP